MKKKKKKSSDQLSCTDVGTLRAVDVVQRLGRRLVHPPTPLLHRTPTKEYYRIYHKHVDWRLTVVSDITRLLYPSATKYIAPWKSSKRFVLCFTPTVVPFRSTREYTMFNYICQFLCIYVRVPLKFFFFLHFLYLTIRLYLP